MNKPNRLGSMIGLRYLLPSRRGAYVSFISFVSIGGIGLGVFSLIVVISVMNGLQSELRNRLLGVAAHLVVETDNSKPFDWEYIEKTVKAEPGVLATAPYIESDVMLSNGQNVVPSSLRGIVVEREPEVSSSLTSIIDGSRAGLKRIENGIVIGAELAYQLGLSVGDSVAVIVPVTKNDGASIVPLTRTFQVVGVFKANVHQYDSNLVLVNFFDALGFLEQVSAQVGLRAKLRDIDDASNIAQRLRSKVSYDVKDWTQLHQTFFAAIKVEKVVMFTILLLIITVATFNIVATLAMGVSQKRSDIAILKTMGASPFSILKIFFVQGSVLGVLGTVVGVVSGVYVAKHIELVVSTLERALGFQIFPADVFYISYVPSEVQASDVIFVALFALLITVLASIYPAIRAAKVQPAESLRYE